MEYSLLKNKALNHIPQNKNLTPNTQKVTCIIPGRANIMLEANTQRNVNGVEPPKVRLEISL